MAKLLDPQVETLSAILPADRALLPLQCGRKILEKCQSKAHINCMATKSRVRLGHLRQITGS